MNNCEINSILKDFELNADNYQLYGSGHINDTYLVQAKGRKYILQKVNTSIFKDIDGMMNNIKKVTNHIKNLGKIGLEILDYKKPWRLYSYIDNAYSVDLIEKPEQAFTAAAAFGEFQNDLASLDSNDLIETIPKFHDTVDRLRLLDQSIDEDKFNRVKDVKKELDFVNKRRTYANKILDLIAEDKIPVRITHNDTKINNVMLDKNTDKAICIVDLDTVMPGCALYDFGDMVRTATASADEDEKDLSKMFSKEEYFEALVKGYLGQAKFLNKYEIENLVFSGILITFTIGIRFLTDYLSGDVYFKTDYDDHNLVRAKTQFKLVRSIEEKKDKYDKIVRKYI